MNDTIHEALARRARLARDWMFAQSLPLWAQAGPDPRGGFRERLALDGGPMTDETTRVRVQARQTYCFALARTLGWQPQRSEALVARGVDTLLNTARRADGLFGRRISYDGSRADDLVDLYDTAFVLLALSWAARTGHAMAGPAADALGEAIDEQLCHAGELAGFRETVPEPGHRLQNPHMHLYEASLAHFEARGATRSLARAREIERLLVARFIEPETGGLREVFSGAWGPAEDDRFEAGHQYEWVWLLHARARLDGCALPDVAQRLLHSGLSLTGEAGQVFLAHDLDGRVRDPTQRTWGLTEALKAHLVAHEAGGGQGEAGPRALACFDRLWRLHVAPAPMGGWIDAYDGEDQPLSTDMTAATGYHLYLAIVELMRVGAITP